MIPEDLNSIFSRIEQYKQLVCTADEVVITLGCSDSRVRFPLELVPVHRRDGTTLNVAFIFLSTIGGGTPSRSRLRKVCTDIMNWGVNKERLKILVTQHGDTSEIVAQKGHLGFSKEAPKLVSCGLRAFFATYADQLTQLHILITAWADRVKQQTNQPSFLADGVSFDQLEADCPEIVRIIDAVSNQASSGEFVLPRRLILRAAYRTTTFDIEENGEAVRSRIAEFLREAEFGDIFTTCTVGLADYDHNKKCLHFGQSYTTLGWAEQELCLPGVPERTVAYQDPLSIAYTFSKTLLPVPDAVLLPSLCTTPDATFRVATSTPTPEIFFCGLAEASYALLHHVAGHDDNFRHLAHMYIFCDDPQYYAVVQESLNHAEYKRDFSRLMHAALPQGSTIILMDGKEVTCQNVL